VKFLVDAHLPKTLSGFLCSKGFDSIHTLELPDKNKTKDYQIIALSEQENRVVISKDTDFLDSFLLTRQPQKLILVRTGNIPNADLLKIFDKNIDEIVNRLQGNSLIEIYKNEIVTHS